MTAEESVAGAMKDAHSPQDHYLPHIDGLRAIAVLLVIGFHIFPTWVPGGYVGVDIFFVISGYLITGLILDNLVRKRFSFAEFYARRVRRIFPALALVLGACFAAGWFRLLPIEFASLGLNILGGASFVSNFVLLHQAGYFDIDAASKPLLHLWSLGIEEQFYIVWPACLLLVWRLRLSVAGIAALLLLCSFAWNIVLQGNPADFYLPMTRAWELMAGAILAAGGNLVISQSSLRPNGLAFFGAIAIAASVIVLNRESVFPGWWALLPVFGTACVIAADGSWINRTILSQGPVVAIGLISYPLYLWHWPLLAFATIAEPQGVPRLTRVAIVAASVSLAALTYVFLERPVRQSKWRFKIVALCFLMAAIGVAGAATVHSQGFAFRMPVAFQDVRAIPLDRLAQWRLGSCFLDQNENSPDEHFSPTCVEQQRPLIFFWGDSVSAALYPGLIGLRSSHNFGLAQFGTAGCPPVLNFPVIHRPHCVEDNAVAFAKLSETHPDVVLLYSAWDFGDIYPRLDDLISKLRALKIPRIIVMGPPPEWLGGLTKAAYDYYKADPLHQMIPTYSDFRLAQVWNRYQAAFSEHARRMPVEYISTWDVLCKEGKCRTWVDFPGGNLTAFDSVHLTTAGSHFVADAIVPCLFPNPQVLRPTFCR